MPTTGPDATPEPDTTSDGGTPPVIGPDVSEAEGLRLAHERAEQLLGVSTALGGAVTTAQVTDVIIQAALPIFRASVGLIGLLSEDGTALECERIVGVPDAEAEAWRTFPLDTRVPLADAVRGRTMVALITPEAQDAAYPELAETRSRAAAGAVMAVPLLVGGRCVGGLGLIAPPECCAGGDQQTFLWTLAGQCALALDRARLFDAERRARKEAAEEVAERRRAEEALQETNEWLRLALRSGGFASGNADLASRRFVAVSDDYKAHFGVPPDAEFSLDTVVEAIHPEDRPGVRAAFTRAVAEGSGYEAEYRVVWPDGAVRWISANGMPIADPTGKPVRMIGVVQDVTARKELESTKELALREAQERADRDPLTGLLNHRAFYQRLEEEALRAGREGTTLAVAVLDMDNFKYFNDLYGHPVGDEVLRTVAGRLRAVCRPYDTVARFGGDEFAMLMGGIGSATQHEIEARLRSQLDGLSFLPPGQDAPITLSVSLGVALFPEHGPERSEVVRRADERLLRAKTGDAVVVTADDARAGIRGAAEGFPLLDALVTAVDNKDRYTRRHSEDVMRHSLGIAEELGMGPVEQRTVAAAALLHDLGKIGVPDHILRKPGRLTDDEFEVVKQHPQIGAIIVQGIPGLEDTLGAVRHHHERWDGGGYPSGLRGEEIPLVARLMAVADAFSAMTSDRPYRKAMGRGQALAILAAGAGTQWDPVCVEAFRPAPPMGPVSGGRNETCAVRP